MGLIYSAGLQPWMIFANLSLGAAPGWYGSGLWLFGNGANS